MNTTVTVPLLAQQLATDFPTPTKHLKSLHLAKEPEKIVLMGTLHPLVELQVIHATEFLVFKRRKCFYRNIHNKVLFQYRNKSNEFDAKFFVNFTICFAILMGTRGRVSSVKLRVGFQYPVLVHNAVELEWHFK